MNLYNSELYMRDVIAVAEYPLDWNRLCGKGIAISGATGMIGSFLVDVLLYRNRHINQNTDIYIIGRNYEKTCSRFSDYISDEHFHFIEWDINTPAECAVWKDCRVAYMIHAASNTHPVAYSSDPVGTISANVMGTDHMLTLATQIGCERFVFLSSVEIYGENRGDVNAFAEDYLGYIDCNTLRAGYPESKRTGEALCQAYKKQYGMSVVIPRLSRVYGPTMLMSDTKALSQFLLKGVHGEDIVLKSEGTQLFSYSYVADAVSAICKVMFDGEDGEAYNVASAGSDVRLRDLAAMIAAYAGEAVAREQMDDPAMDAEQKRMPQVIFELPDAVEAAGYSTATVAVLDTAKLSELGWYSMYDMKKGLHHTMDILREIQV